MSSKTEGSPRRKKVITKRRIVKKRVGRGKGPSASGDTLAIGEQEINLKEIKGDPMNSEGSDAIVKLTTRGKRKVIRKVVRKKASGPPSAQKPAPVKASESKKDSIASSESSSSARRKVRSLKRSKSDGSAMKLASSHEDRSGPPIFHPKKIKFDMAHQPRAIPAMQDSFEEFERSLDPGTEAKFLGISGPKDFGIELLSSTDQVDVESELQKFDLKRLLRRLLET